MKTLKKVYRAFLWFLNVKVLGWIDSLNAKKNVAIEFPPIFIIGAPRSGSTVLMQVLCNAFDLGYTTNLHAKFYGSPHIIERIVRYIGRRKKSSFSSQFGRASGWHEPSECGEFWYRFFPRNPAYTTSKDVSESAMTRLRCSIAKFTRVSGKPILFKNMYVSLRLEPILKAFPEALFIVTDRDILENAHSLLEVRKKIHGQYDKWWSMEPPNVKSLKNLTSAEQVVGQVKQIQKLIDADLERLSVDSSKIFHVSYEAFCSDVHKSVSDIGAFFKKNNVDLSPSYDVPAVFKVRNSYSIPEELLNELKVAVNET